MGSRYAREDKKKGIFGYKRFCFPLIKLVCSSSMSSSVPHKIAAREEAVPVPSRHTGRDGEVGQERWGKRGGARQVRTAWACASESEQERQKGNWRVRETARERWRQTQVLTPDSDSEPNTKV